ncbi:MAG: ABC transporter permease subunit [Verrucomicrobiota bacterium]
MKLNTAILAALWRNDLRMLLRDRRTLVMSILLPMIVMPIFLGASTWTGKHREYKLETTVYRYALCGDESNAVRRLVEATRDRLLSETNRTFQFDELAVTNARVALDRAELHFYLEQSSTNPPAGRPGAPAIQLVFRGDRDDSSAGMGRMRSALEETRSARRKALLLEHGLDPATLAVYSETNVASRGQVAGLALGRMVSLVLLLFLFSGGAVVANDLVAGEKERGTLETLLTTGAGRLEIVLAKQLVIFTVAVVIACVQTANLLVYVGFKLIPVPAGLAAAVSPGTALLLLFLFLPIAAIVSSALLLVSGYARSYKEAQLYFVPVFLLGLLPAVAPLLPGVSLRSAIILVPIANLALAVKDVLVGSFDWPFIALSWLVTAAAATALARAGVRLLSDERRLTASESDAVEARGGPELFERRVLTWFAILWAALLMVNNYMTALDVRGQITVNLVGFFGVTCAFLIRHYRLPLRQTLSWRLPRPGVWLGVACGIPGGLLTGIGLFRLANLVLPVPQEMLEGFNESILAGSLSPLQLIFFFALMPGFFEEITFRGVLLYGLRRRLRPGARVVVVGLAFGLFHMALFRLVPTAFLGMLFAAVTLLTGSIFPAMAWHAGSNLTSLIAERWKYPLSDLDPWCYFAGAAMLAVAFRVFWANRKTV